MTSTPVTTATAVADLPAAARAALAELLLTMADDEFVSGFTDSEWTGIAPLLEEDVAISSISQDELGHARALYQLLAAALADGRDEDALAYDREPDEYRHARLLDHPRGDWAETIARRFLYELADEARLASIGAGYRPLAELVDKLRREERYHRMHLVAWIQRLANGGPESRRRLEAALVALGADAATVFSPLQGEHFGSSVPLSQRAGLPDSVVVQTGTGRLLVRSAAVIEILQRLGGVWWLIGVMAICLPQKLLDGCYDLVARLRLKLFTPPPTACPLLPADLQERFQL